MAEQPLICYDGIEHWVVYPSDNSYQMVEKIKPGEDGVISVEPALLEMLKGWWYHKAVEKAEAAVAGLEIPWEELQITGADVEQGDLLALTKKLATASTHIVHLNDILTGAMVRMSAAKEAVDQAVHQMMASREAQEEGRPPAIAIRIAALIHKHKPLRNAKIEIIEAGATIKALEVTKDSLDILWRTASRIISARLKEPVD